MSQPSFFPPSTEMIQALDHTTKRLVIDTANWPQMRQIIASQSKDPLSTDFNWLFWCGFITKKDFHKFSKIYKKNAGYLKYFTGNISEISKIVNEHVKSPFPKLQNIQRNILIESITQINNDRYLLLPTLFQCHQEV